MSSIFVETLNEILQNIHSEKATKQIDVIIALLEKTKLTNQVASQITSFCEQLVKTRKTEKKGYRIMTLIMKRYHTPSTY